MRNGSLIIISGPSGSGKTTLYNRLLASRVFKRLVKSISVTTRPKRAGERHGCDYFYISRKMFLYKKRRGHFLESQKVFDNYYGTPKQNVLELLKKGKNVLLCIDVKGAKVVCRHFPNAVRIFICPPNMDILKSRLEKRASEKKEALHLRLETARLELKEAKHYDYVIINDDLKKAFRDLTKAVRTAVSF